MPKEVFGRDYRFLDRRELLTFEEIDRLAQAFVRQGVEKIRITGGEPLVRRDLETPDRHAGRDRRARPDPDDERLAAAAEGAAAPCRRARRVTVSLDSLDDEVFRTMNDVDFPVARVLEGIDAAAAAGLTPVKVNMVVKRGVNDGSVLAMARRFHGTGHILRFIEYMDVGHTNGWRMDDVVPGAEILGDDRRRAADRARRAELRGRGRAALALPRRRRRDRSHLVRHAAVLRRLHAGPALCRGPSLHVPVRRARARPARDRARRVSDDELDNAIAGIWRGRTDRYSELRTAETAAEPKIEMSYIGG